MVISNVQLPAQHFLFCIEGFKPTGMCSSATNFLVYFMYTLMKKNKPCTAIFTFQESSTRFLFADRKENIRYVSDGNPSIKDAIEALGVPHTGVHLITVNDLAGKTPDDEWKYRYKSISIWIAKSERVWV